MSLKPADDDMEGPLDEDDCPPTEPMDFGDELEYDCSDIEIPDGVVIEDTRDGPADHEMVELMDVLQCLGVSAEDACRYSVKVLKRKLTFMEVYGRGSIIEEAHGPERNLNIEGLQAFDLRSGRADGRSWDFTQKADRMEALHIVRVRKPTWLIGSPPCTSFSIMNEGLNYRKMDPVKVAKLKKIGLKHLRFMISLYQIQLAEGRHFLHEHPSSASSWRDQEMVRLLGHGRVNVVTMDQCMYGLATPGPNGVQIPAKKPTRWASTSAPMLRRLSTKCLNHHKHRHFLGGRAASAAFYPRQLVVEILRGMRDTSDLEEP